MTAKTLVPRQRPGPRSAAALLRSALDPGLRRGAVLPLLLLTASAPPDLPAGSAPLDPIAFFSGETHGSGTLRPVIGKSVVVTVRSIGHREGSSLVLAQRIKEGDKPERDRTWIMRPNGPGRYTGTLTDADGPVSVTITGPRASVVYKDKSGYRIRQQLALQADGHTILNRLEASKFGIRLATLDETIRKPLAK